MNLKKFACPSAMAIILALILISNPARATLSIPAGKSSGVTLTGLKVQHLVSPLSVEDKNPVFSWKMESLVAGQKQTAYRIIVTRTGDKKIVWDSQKVESGLSDNIVYDGEPLGPETGYTWDLSVWDAKRKMATAASHFETGLMDPGINAWEGAGWIGSNKLTLDAASAFLFEIRTGFRILPGSKGASLVFGANDFRLNDRFQNIENVAGKNYIRLEIDISGTGTPSGTAINIYRVGYGKGDSETVPFKVISTGSFPETNLNQIITQENKHSAHNLSIIVDAGNISILIDGNQVLTAAPQQERRTPGGQPQTGGGQAGGPPRLRGQGLSVSNYGTGGNYNTFPNLNSVGFGSKPGDSVIFSDYMIINKGQSNPENNILLSATAGPTYSIFSGLPGVTADNTTKTIRIENNTQDLLIGYADPSYGSVTMLRTGFRTHDGKKILKARLFATAMGAVEMYINGKRMGEDWFNPGSTQFRETIGYHVSDVTKQLSNGSNCIGAILSPGWFTGPMTFTTGNLNFFGDTEALLAKLVITYDDGSRQVVVSDPLTWKLFKDGPLEYGSFFHGERYNANKEALIAVNGDPRGWSTTLYNDSEWSPAETVKQREWINFRIVARYDHPVRIAEILTASGVTEVHSDDSHTFTYDMGVNMVGVPSVTIPAGWLRKGDVVILRYGEQLYPGHPGDDSEYVELYGRGGTGRNVAGRILTETYRAALATDFYTASGDQSIVIQPSTTYRGYQYVQITIPHATGPLPAENVKGLVLSSDNLPTGTYEAVTSDGSTGKLVNQLFRNIQRSQLGNFFTIPTDCPQRNERMGWTGDAQAYSRTATYNSDSRNFFRQWMVALRDDQGIGSETEAPGGIGSTVPTYNKADATSFADGTTWAAAVCMVPWQLFIQYGDKQVVAENMDAMERWLDGMDFYDFSSEYPHLSAKTTGLADWLAVGAGTPSQLVNNAIYIYMLEVTAIMADAIGKNDIAIKFRDRHRLAREEWNRAYVDPETGKTRNVDGTFVHTQTSYATPLNFNVFSDENMKRAQDYLAELTSRPSVSSSGDATYPPFSITTGFSGTPNILPSLSRAGKTAEAFSMFSSAKYPSWLYPVTMGATSVWERWNGYEAAFARNNQNSMNSFNHFALGAVGQWMYEFQLGITTDHANGEAGYKHFVLQPSAGGTFTSLSGSYDSDYGVIKSGWMADGNGKITTYDATVPPNTTATLYLPVFSGTGKFRSNKGAAFVKVTKRNNIDVAQYELSSGSHKFIVSDQGVLAGK